MKKEALEWVIATLARKTASPCDWCDNETCPVRAILETDTVKSGKIKITVERCLLRRIKPAK